MSSFKEILGHGRNYLIASLATKALGFISIPFYTRFLSTTEYGIVSIFIGVVGILNSIMTLGIDCAISRYYFDQKDSEDFKNFIGISSFMAGIIFIINSLLIILFAGYLSQSTKLPKELIFFFIPVVLTNIIGLTFEQIYGPMKKSSLIASSSLFRVYLTFGISVVFILILKNNKYFGPVIGQTITGLLMIVFWLYKIKPYIKFPTIRKNQILYILTYSIPLIPYTLSGVLIEQFAKLSIANIQDVSQTGFYTLALSIAGLTSLFIGITHQAWNPYYFEYMNNKNYKKLDQDLCRIFKITLFAAIFISAFGNEIGKILAPARYSGLLYLIPIFSIGYIFYQLAYVYMRNFGYSRKTIYLTLIVLFSSIINIFLNILLIPSMGEIGAAVSFSFSYMIMAVLSWLINKYIICCYGSHILTFIKYILYTLPLFIIIYYVLKTNHYIFSLSVRFMMLTGASIILFWKEKEYIINILKFFKKK
jgi:O-antigen/teichoic acid export membrane protein